MCRARRRRALYAAEENQRSFERAGEVIDNSVVTGKVKTALLRDSEVKGLDISVVSRDGEVILAGSAESRRQADRAAKIAQGVKGVKKVTNKIVVKGDDLSLFNRQRQGGTTVKCYEIMTPNPRSCSPLATAQETAQIMLEEDVGSVPMVEDGSQRLVGIVTDRDLCLRVVAGGDHPMEVPVAECMNAALVTCRPDDDIEVAEELMKEHQIRSIPVVDPQDRCVGMIAQADIALQEKEPNNVRETVREISRPMRAA